MVAVNLKFPSFSNRALSPQTGKIGLDMGLEKINMVQIEKMNENLSIRTALSLDYPSTPSARNEFLRAPDTCKKFFHNIFRNYPFKGRSIVATLPADKVKLILVNFKTSDSSSEEQLIINAIRSRSGDSLDSSLIDYITVNPRIENQSDQSALVAIADKKDVLDYLELMRKCGLEVETLEISPIAINRLLCTMHKDQIDTKVLAINFGTQKSYLTVTWGRRLLLDRTVDFGLNVAVDTLANTLEMESSDILNLLEQYGFDGKSESGTEQLSADRQISQTLTEILKPLFKKLASEINEVLVYTAAETRGGAIEQIYLFGSIARWKGTDRIIDKLISLPVTTINPLFGIGVNESALIQSDIQPTSGIAVATGLALKGLVEYA